VTVVRPAADPERRISPVRCAAAVRYPSVSTKIGKVGATQPREIVANGVGSCHDRGASDIFPTETTFARAT
jgi:hypothetical protein